MHKRRKVKMGKRLLSGAILAIYLFGLWSCSKGTPAQPADTILFNGKVITVDGNFSIAQAVAIKGGKIQAVGTNEDIQRLAGPGTQKIDLQGRTAMPGMADNHLHDIGGGPGVDLSRVRTMEEVLRAIAERVKQSRPGDIITTNSDWHEAQLKEQRLPFRKDLDAISPNNPVVVIRGGHEYVLNSAALKKWKITTSTPVPPGGQISRYEDGTLDGELLDRAKSLVQIPPSLLDSTLPSNTSDELEGRIRKRMEEYQKLNAVGLTSVRHPGAPVSDYRLLQEMEKRKQLSIRVNFLIRLSDAKTAEDVDRIVDSWNVQPDEGDEWLRIGGVKLGVDGGFEGGWMRKPYEEPYGRHGKFFGLNTTPQEVYTTLVKELARRNWRVATHAVGDAAIDEVLAGYEAANEVKSIVGRRWSIEHGFIPAPEHFQRINKLGVMLSAQDHLYVAGPSLKKYWGSERANWVTPMRAYIDNHVPVSGGTDSAVVPYPPLWVIYHFVTRDTISGGVFGKGQAITRKEAIQAVTTGYSYLTFDENVKGSLEPGKLADLVVLSEDILTCPETHIRDMSVLMTIVGGQVVYKDPQSGL
jgi:predicted amidohydrolase YtcJ